MPELRKRGRPKTDISIRNIDMARAKVVTAAAQLLAEMNLSQLSREFRQANKVVQGSQSKAWNKHSKGAPITFKIVVKVLEKHPKVAAFYWHPLWTLLDSRAHPIDRMAALRCISPKVLQIISTSNAWISEISPEKVKQLTATSSVDALTGLVGIYALGLFSGVNIHQEKKQQFHSLENAITQFGLNILESDPYFCVACSDIMKLIKDLKLNAISGKVFPTKDSVKRRSVFYVNKKVCIAKVIIHPKLRFAFTKIEFEAMDATGRYIDKSVKD